MSDATIIAAAAVVGGTLPPIIYYLIDYIAQVIKPASNPELKATRAALEKIE